MRKQQEQEVQYESQGQQSGDQHVALEQYAGCCVAIAATGFLLAAGVVIGFFGATAENAEVSASTFGAIAGALLEASLWLVLAAILRGFQYLLRKKDKTAETMKGILEELKKQNSE